MKYKILRTGYCTLVRPVLFKCDAETVHNSFSKFGSSLGDVPFYNSFMENYIAYKSDALQQTICGVKFDNPIGLAAGFDYDGQLSAVFKGFGFGFNTVGTVTAKPYEGNTAPRLARLVKSKSLLVNKGFKSQGAEVVAGRLNKKDLTGVTLGISVGSSNIPQVDTIAKAIDDYLYTLNVFKDKPYVRYFEINISCPNTQMKETFTNEKNLQQLLTAVQGLDIKQPLFIKMPNEAGVDLAENLVKTALSKQVNGFIFSNLVKDRSNLAFDKSEIAKVELLKGNFSGKPTYNNSNMLIKHIRTVFANDIYIIGCGGVFNALDAIEKIESGANLVQLITGMIFNGPTIAAEINHYLVTNKILQN